MNEATQIEEPISTAELAAKPVANSEASGPLLPPEFVQDLRKRWDGIQTGFVDEPRAAVRQADELVASALKRLAGSFAEARNTLQGQWARAVFDGGPREIISEVSNRSSAPNSTSLES